MCVFLSLIAFHVDLFNLQIFFQCFARHEPAGLTPDCLPDEEDSLQAHLIYSGLSWFVCVILLLHVHVDLVFLALNLIFLYCEMS